MSDVLHKICDAKREHIAKCKAEISEDTLTIKAKRFLQPRGFLTALKANKPALIAEIKRASPSKGVLREDFNPAELAKALAEGGATCLSVLTDKPFFEGQNDFLTKAYLACDLPILRKDFMLDPYQVTEARAIGADCILLIMAAVSDRLAKEIEAAAKHWGMDVLVEVHNEAELERALTHLSSPLIGINNRNLRTLEIDLSTSVRLRPLVPETHTVVCESGIQSHADIAQMQAHNIHCFLVGESLMLQRNITQATRELLGQ